MNNLAVNVFMLKNELEIQHPVVMSSINLPGIKNGIKKSGYEVLDVIILVLFVIGVIALIVTFAGYWFNKDSGDIKGWLIGITVSCVVLAIVTGFSAFVKF